MAITSLANTIWKFKESVSLAELITLIGGSLTKSYKVAVSLKYNNNPSVGLRLQFLGDIKRIEVWLYELYIQGHDIFSHRGNNNLVLNDLIGDSITIAGGPDEEEPLFILLMYFIADLQPGPALQEKTLTLPTVETAVVADEGYYGLSKVNITYNNPTIYTKEAFNNNINIIRGDCLDIQLTINLNTDMNPSCVDFFDTRYRNYKVYFGLMEPNQAFEDSILYKEYLIDDSLLSDPTSITTSGDLIIKLQSEDTFCMHPGRYFYSIKLKDPNTNQISTVINNCEINIL